MESELRLSHGDDNDIGVDDATSYTYNMGGSLSRLWEIPWVKAFLVLLVVALIGILVWYFTKGSGSKSWTNDEIQEAVNQFIGDGRMSYAEPLMRCIITEISKGISYEDYSAKSATEKAQYIANHVGDLGSCLGKKGAWSSVLKDFVKQTMLLIKLSEECTNCIVKNMEKEIDPVVIIQDMMSGSTTGLAELAAQIIEFCKDECKGDDS